MITLPKGGGRLALLLLLVFPTSVLAEALVATREDGTEIARLMVPEGTGWCVLWHHSVKGFEVADCYENRGGHMVLVHSHLPDFAAACHRLLKPDGLLALQYITVPDHRYDALRSGVDSIQKHIFPGSLLLSVNRLNSLLSEKGGFVLHAFEDFGSDYSKTLRHWRASFSAKLDQVRALGFDDRFIRKWHYYLCYCEAAFALRHISVVHTLHSRANNLSLK